MKTPAVLSCILAIAALPLSAQNVSDVFDPGIGQSLQSWQDPDLPKVRANCRNPAPALTIPPLSPQLIPEPPVLTTTAIAGVIEEGLRWETVWSWGGNNADGLIATEDGGIIFANNDASNIIKLNLDGSAEIIYENTNTSGAVSRSKNGDLFVLNRGLNSSIDRLEPERHIFADKYQGDPLDCVSGIMNDLAADNLGGVYFTVSGAGLYYANANGVVEKYGDDTVVATNGIILSPDEETLYVTNAGTVVAFDVQDNGALTNQRIFASLSRGGGDGMAVDAEGRVYVPTGGFADDSVDVFAADGSYLGNIPGVPGLHGVAFSGEDKRYLYAIVLNNNFTFAAAHRIIRIPMLAQGYLGRAK